jgi:oxygen-dependent protoporphyrinogen oxidase
MTDRTYRIAVIGGGIAGLSSAYYMVKEAKAKGISVSVQLYEKENRFGGKIQTERYQGLIMEGGPDSILARKTAGPDLCRELGIADELVGTNPHARKNYIVHHGKLRLMPPGTMMGIPAEIVPFVKTSLISPIGKLRAGMDLLIPKGDTKHDQSLGLFLRRRLGNELLENLVEPLMAGIYAGDANQLSLQATFPQFQEMEETYRSLILGIVSQRKRSNTNANMTAPSAKNSNGKANSGQEKLPNSVFLSLRTGLERLIEVLVDHLREQQVGLRLNTGVQRIIRDDSGSGRYVISLDNGETEVADAVIAASPAFQTRQMLERMIALPQLEKIPYVSVSTIMLAYPKEAIPQPLDASGFVVPKKENRMITACTYVSNKWTHTAPKDRVLLRCYVGRAGDQRFRSLTDEEIVQYVRQDLRQLMGIDATPSFTRVVRWDQAMPQYLVGHLDRMKEIEAKITSEIPGVFITGAGYYGLGVPDCILQARKTAARVCDHLIN